MRNKVRRDRLTVLICPARMRHELEFLHELTQRSDGALLAGSLEIAGRQHRDTAGLVAHLAVIDDRRLYLRDHSSLFAYCREALRRALQAARRSARATAAQSPSNCEASMNQPTTMRIATTTQA